MAAAFEAPPGSPEANQALLSFGSTLIRQPRGRRVALAGLLELSRRGKRSLDTLVANGFVRQLVSVCSSQTTRTEAAGGFYILCNLAQDARHGPRLVREGALPIFVAAALHGTFGEPYARKPQSQGLRNLREEICSAEMHDHLCRILVHLLMAAGDERPPPRTERPLWKEHLMPKGSLRLRLRRPPRKPKAAPAAKYPATPSKQRTPKSGRSPHLSRHGSRNRMHKSGSRHDMRKALAEKARGASRRASSVTSGTGATSRRTSSVTGSTTDWGDEVSEDGSWSGSEYTEEVSEYTDDDSERSSEYWSSDEEEESEEESEEDEVSEEPSAISDDPSNATEEPSTVTEEPSTDLVSDESSLPPQTVHLDSWISDPRSVQWLRWQGARAVAALAASVRGHATEWRQLLADGALDAMLLLASRTCEVGEERERVEACPDVRLHRVLPRWNSAEQGVLRVEGVTLPTSRPPTGGAAARRGSGSGGARGVVEAAAAALFGALEEGDEETTDDDETAPVQLPMHISGAGRLLSGLWTFGDLCHYEGLLAEAGGRLAQDTLRRFTADDLKRVRLRYAAAERRQAQLDATGMEELRNPVPIEPIPPLLEWRQGLMNARHFSRVDEAAFAVVRDALGKLAAAAQLTQASQTELRRSLRAAEGQAGDRRLGLGERLQAAGTAARAQWLADRARFEARERRAVDARHAQRRWRHERRASVDRHGMRVIEVVQGMRRELDLSELDLRTSTTGSEDDRPPLRRFFDSPKGRRVIERIRQVGRAQRELRERQAREEAELARRRRGLLSREEDDFEADEAALAELVRVKQEQARAEAAKAEAEAAVRRERELVEQERIAKLQLQKEAERREREDAERARLAEAQAAVERARAEAAAGRPQSRAGDETAKFADVRERLRRERAEREAEAKAEADAADAEAKAAEKAAVLDKLKTYERHVEESMWEMQTDPTTGDVYYVHKRTGETAWEIPIDGDWVQRDDGAGTVWYENVKTGETRWDLPEAGSGEWGPEWTTCYTDEGAVYYYNTETGESVWG